MEDSDSDSEVFGFGSSDSGESEGGGFESDDYSSSDGEGAGKGADVVQGAAPIGAATKSWGQCSHLGSCTCPDCGGTSAPAEDPPKSLAISAAIATSRPTAAAGVEIARAEPSLSPPDLGGESAFGFGAADVDDLDAGHDAPESATGVHPSNFGFGNGAPAPSPPDPSVKRTTTAEDLHYLCIQKGGVKVRSKPSDREEVEAKEGGSGCFGIGGGAVKARVNVGDKAWKTKQKIKLDQAIIVSATVDDAFYELSDGTGFCPTVGKNESPTWRLIDEVALNWKVHYGFTCGHYPCNESFKMATRGPKDCPEQTCQQRYHSGEYKTDVSFGGAFARGLVLGAAGGLDLHWTCCGSTNSQARGCCTRTVVTKRLGPHEPSSRALTAAKLPEVAIAKAAKKVAADEKKFQKSLAGLKKKIEKGKMIREELVTWVAANDRTDGSRLEAEFTKEELDAARIAEEKALNESKLAMAKDGAASSGIVTGQPATPQPERRGSLVKSNADDFCIQYPMMTKFAPKAGVFYGDFITDLVNIVELWNSPVNGARTAAYFCLGVLQLFPVVLTGVDIWTRKSGGMGYLGILLNFTNTRLLYIGLGGVVCGDQDRNDAAEAAARAGSDLKLLEAVLESMPQLVITCALLVTGIINSNDEFALFVGLLSIAFSATSATFAVTVKLLSLFGEAFSILHVAGIALYFLCDCLVRALSLGVIFELVDDDYKIHVVWPVIAIIIGDVIAQGLGNLYYGEELAFSVSGVDAAMSLFSSFPLSTKTRDRKRLFYVSSFWTLVIVLYAVTNDFGSPEDDALATTSSNSISRRSIVDFGLSRSNDADLPAVNYSVVTATARTDWLRAVSSISELPNATSSLPTNVKTLTACSAAAAALGLSDVTAQFDEGRSAGFDPAGCYYEDSSLKFNNGDNTGPCTTSDRCLCGSTTTNGNAINSGTSGSTDSSGAETVYTDPVPGFDLLVLGRICGLLWALKSITYYLAINWMEPGDSSTDASGFQIFAITTNDEAQQNALTPTDWVQRLMNTEKYEEKWNKNISFGSKEDKKKAKKERPVARNIIKALALAQSDAATERLHLVNTQIGKMTTKAGDDGPLSRAFGAENLLRDVALPGNLLKNEGVAIICKPIASHKEIRVLDLADNEVDAEGGGAVAEMITTTVGLIQLTLDDNQFGSAIPEVMAALGRNETILEFYFEGTVESNASTDQTALGESSAGMLEANATLQLLSLSRNRLPSSAFEPLMVGLDNTTSNKTLQTIYLNSCCAGDSGARLLGGMFGKNHTLAKVQLRNNGFQDPGGTAIADALPKNRGLKDLDLQMADFRFITLVLIHNGGLNGNDPKITTDGTDSKLRRCGGAMNNDPKIKDLDISSCNIRPYDANWLKTAVLDQNMHVTTLDVDSNPLESDGGGAVGSSLRENRTIRNLSMCDCQIGDSGGRTIAHVLEAQGDGQGGLSGRLSITKNNMSFVPVVLIHRGTLDGAKASVSSDFPDAKLQNCAKAMHNGFVHKLELDDCRVLSAGAQWLGTEIVEINEYVNHLNVSRNNIGTSGAEAIAKGIRENEGTGIQTLHMEHNGIGDRGGAAVASALPSSRISNLYINNNDLGGSAGASFGRAFEHDCPLVMLQISNNGLGGGGVSSLCNGLSENECLRSLYVNSCSCGNKGAQSLAFQVFQHAASNAVRTVHVANNGCSWWANCEMHQYCLKGEEQCGEGIELRTTGDQDNQIRTAMMANNDSQITTLNYDGKLHFATDDCDWLGSKIEDADYLIELSVENTGLDSSTLPRLVPGLAHNTSIRKLFLANNPVGSGNGSDAMARMIATNSTMEHLDMSNCSPGSGAVDIVNACRQNSALDSLNLQNCSIPTSSGTRIAGLISGTRLGHISLRDNGLEHNLEFAYAIRDAKSSFSGNIDVDWSSVQYTIEAEEERLRRIEEERQRQLEYERQYASSYDSW